MFYHVPNYNITANTYINKQKYYYICKFKLEKLQILFEDNNILFDYIWCDLLVQITQSEIFKRNIKRFLINTDINNKTYTIFNIYYQIFSKLLIINNNIKEKVSRFIDNFNINPSIGIQIRAGEDVNERQFCDEKDVQMMINIAKRNSKYKKWFITGDSLKYKNKLCKEYKNVILYSQNKTKHYAHFAKDDTIIIEHEILSRTNILIISKSTYGFTALLKSGILLSGNNINSYIVNNKFAYDVKNYLIYFLSFS